MAKQRVLLDSCIIIEAVRTGMWQVLAAHFALETVERCVEECCTGDPLKPGYVPMDIGTLRSGLTATHSVTALDLIMLVEHDFRLGALDDGERHLLAWLHANAATKITAVLSTSDRAAIHGAHMINVLSNVQSLEQLATTAKVDPRQRRALNDHFSEAWLSDVRLQAFLGKV